jgi:hypothetical protein
LEALTGVVNNLTMILKRGSARDPGQHIAAEKVGIHIESDFVLRQEPQEQRDVRFGSPGPTGACGQKVIISLPCKRREASKN